MSDPEQPKQGPPEEDVWARISRLETRVEVNDAVIETLSTHIVALLVKLDETAQKAELEGQRADQAELAAKLAEEGKLEAQEEARIDPLTGVLNRRGLTRAYEMGFRGHGRRAGEKAVDTPSADEVDELAEPETSVGTNALLFCDIDEFKRVNSLLGHDGGDLVIVAVFHAIAAQLRGGDALGRWGGDEAVWLAHDVDLEQAKKIGARAIIMVKAITKIEGLTEEEVAMVRPSITVGAEIIDPARELRAAVKRPSKALIAAKNAGNRGSVVSVEEYLPPGELPDDDGPDDVEVLAPSGEDNGVDRHDDEEVSAVEPEEFPAAPRVESDADGSGGNETKPQD